LVSALAEMGRIIGVDRDQRTGGVYATYIFSIDLGLVVGPLLGGFLFGWIGFAGALWIAAAALLAWAFTGYAPSLGRGA